MTTTTTTVYTAEEVASHSSGKDIWMILHGGVYDLTKFLTEHPGGEEVLLNLAGQDGTICFEEMGHTTEAIQLRENFKIGIVSNEGGSSLSKPNNKASSGGIDDDDWAYEEVKPNNSLLKTFLMLSVLVYAVIFYHLS